MLRSWRGTRPVALVTLVFSDPAPPPSAPSPFPSFWLPHVRLALDRRRVSQPGGRAQALQRGTARRPHVRSDSIAASDIISDHLDGAVVGTNSARADAAAEPDPDAAAERYSDGLALPDPFDAAVAAAELYSDGPPAPAADAGPVVAAADARADVEPASATHASAHRHDA